MPPRKASTAHITPEAFVLYSHFPKYPSSGSRDDQLAFITDMLDEEPPFPNEVHDLWRQYYDEYPICAPKKHQEDIMVRTMSMWRLGPETREKRKETCAMEHRRRSACELEILKRKVADGAQAVQLIHPDFERIPDFERKLAGLIESCVEHPQVSSLELQVCCDFYRSFKFIDCQLTLMFPGNPSWRYGGSGIPCRGETCEVDAQQRVPH